MRPAEAHASYLQFCRPQRFRPPAWPSRIRPPVQRLACGGTTELTAAIRNGNGVSMASHWHRLAMRSRCQHEPASHGSRAEPRRRTAKRSNSSGRSPSRPCCPSPSWQLPRAAAWRWRRSARAPMKCEPWIAKRAARRLYVLTAQASAPLAGRAISESRSRAHAHRFCRNSRGKPARARCVSAGACNYCRDTQGICSGLAPAKSYCTSQGARAGGTSRGKAPRNGA